VPISPIVFAVVFAVVCAGAFLVGLRFYRMAEPPEGASLDQVKRFGRLMMMASTAMLLFLVAVIVRGDLKMQLQ
jgi:hypothetical protein